MDKFDQVLLTPLVRNVFTVKWKKHPNSNLAKLLEKF